MTEQLLLLDPPENRQEAATDEVRLITLNAQNASAGRAQRLAQWVAGQEVADHLVVTEVGYGPGGQALVSALANRGYRSVLALPAAGLSDYRTVLASRSADLTATPSGISELPHRAPAARLRFGPHTVGLLGLYVPSRGNMVKKRRFQDAVGQALPAFLGQFDGPVIVTGDLNVLEPGHTPPHSTFRQWEYDFYKAFPAAGLVDAFRHLHPDLDDHSWFGREGSGYRFDHTFVTDGHKGCVKICQYVHEPREMGLTDHSAMLLRLSLT
ncbi:endonuclease [Streptomyces sp. NPDC006632]|uniref:endonuclease n=1 Tax=Streptomyces sp. NPDC006632 TaxID=3157182 RepID=UPI0033B88B48